MAKSPSATKSRFPWAHTMPSSTIIFSLISLFQRSDGAFCDLTFARCGTMFLEHTPKRHDWRSFFTPQSTATGRGDSSRNQCQLCTKKQHICRGLEEIQTSTEKYPVWSTNSPQNPKIMLFSKEESQPNVIERLTITLTMGILASCPVLVESKDSSQNM